MATIETHVFDITAKYNGETFRVLFLEHQMMALTGVVVGWIDDGLMTKTQAEEFLDLCDDRIHQVQLARAKAMRERKLGVLQNALKTLLKFFHEA